MIKPYTAVGLIPTVRGIRKRSDIMINLEHLSHLVKAAAWLSSLDLPVRLIAFPEGALQGFNDEVLDLDHVQFAREGAIDIPGEETAYLGNIARQYDCFIIAQAKARHPDLKDRFFNVGFILDPKGEVILQHYKVSPLFPVEHSVCPHDVYDWWIEKYGRNLQAFWPVVDTEIGRLGIHASEIDLGNVAVRGFVAAVGKRRAPYAEVFEPEMPENERGLHLSPSCRAYAAASASCERWRGI